MTKSTLDNRIAEAIQTGTSASIAAMLPDVEGAATAAADKAEAARTRALDPLLASKEISEARTESENERFIADRMTAAADRLRSALIAAQETERQAALEVVGKAAKKAQDRLRAERADFEKGAAALARHAENIIVLHHDLTALNDRLREGDCGDLTAVDPLSEMAQSTGQLVVDPLKDLVIWGHWPHTRPKTLKLAG